MQWNSTIIKIGEQAIDPKENIVILFDEKATEKLENVAVIQKFSNETPINDFVLKKDDTITIDGKTYLVLNVGTMVQMNMKAIGHATLVFTDEVPKKPMKNAIYLEKNDNDTIPEFNIDDEIMYEHD